MISDESLKKIAQFDEHTQIKSIQEVYLDYYATNSNLFHLGIESCLGISILDEKLWQRYEYFTFDRIVEGIISVCLSNRIFPVIKCIRNSPIIKRIAKALSEYLQQNIEFIRRECGREQNGLLFLFDRKEDPVTPLLNQWSYQAMLHELIGIKNNICEVKHQNGGKLDKFPLNDYDDKFFMANMNNEFDGVADEIQKIVDKIYRPQRWYCPQMLRRRPQAGWTPPFFFVVFARNLAHMNSSSSQSTSRWWLLW
jgi:vacuolar protein sorting-associated protein 45